VSNLHSIKTQVIIAFEKANVSFPQQLSKKSNNKSELEFLLNCKKWILSDQIQDNHKIVKLLILSQEIFLTQNVVDEAIKIDEILSRQYFNLGEFELSIQKGKKFLTDYRSFNSKIGSNKVVTCYSNIGASYSALGRYDNAIQNLLEAVKLIKKDININLRSVGIVYNDLAGTYQNVGDIKKAKYYYKYALDVLDKNKKDLKKECSIPILVNMGDLYINENNFNKAKLALDKAYKLAQLNKKKSYLSHIQYLRGFLGIEMNDFENSELCLNEALDLAKSIENKVVELECYFYFAKLYFKKRIFKKAISYLYTGLENGGDSVGEEYMKKCYHELYENYKKLNDFENSLKYLEESKSIEFKLNNQRLNSLVENNQKNLDKIQIEMKTLQKEAENKRLKKEIEFKNRELTSKVLFSASNHRFLIDFKNQLNSLNDIKMSLKLINQKIAETQDWNEFESRFNEVHPDFIKNLEEQYPKLSSMELRVCTLIKMGFDTNEIAGLLWISKRGVDQHRYRIKKKIKTSENITPFLLKF
jgi:tetratricopeptide (TPR) repeat protein